MFLSRERATKKPGPPPACPNILTPDRIPQFFIPPQLSTLQNRAPGRNPSSQQGPRGPRSPETSRALMGTANRHVIHIPSLDQTGEASQQLCPAHLASPGGFPILPESPHTRRRESLFHTPCLPQCVSLDLSLVLQPVSPPGDWDSDTASSTSSSPFGSPLLVRSPPCQARGGWPLCRCTLHAQAGGRASSLSTEDASSADNSPCVPRRAAEPSWGSAARLAPPLFFPLDFICRPVRVAQENTVALSRGGRLRLSSEYIPASRRLHVRLVSAEGLYPQSCPPRHVGCCVSLQLRPGQAQKQLTALVQRSRSPIFNEDFFFEGLAPHELPGRSLRLKALSKGCGVRRDTVLGEAEVPLPALLPS
ncbi:C2 calcium-dependent domain-containing protein 4D [Pelodiscus sinensis]|uniref:C2 calcium-dependent domain-containing protein 4D n=1 Tax=Pelodiscus sinensis TaxID=13735 RepID=UPI003F6AD1F4